jgi:hypothetical protein
MQSKPAWVSDLGARPKNQNFDVLDLEFAVLYFLAC